MKRFDVALWRSRSSLLFGWPEWIGVLEADDAYSAVVQLMHVYGLSEVEYASARALDRSIIYRCFKVKNVPQGVVCFTGRCAKNGHHSREMRSDVFVGYSAKVVEGD